MPSSDVNKYVLRGGEVDRDKRTVFRSESAVRAFAFHDVQKEAENRVREAQVREHAAVAKEKRDISAELERVRTEGYQKGVSEASTALEETRSMLEEQLQGALAYFHEALKQTEARAVQDAVRLGLTLAEKLTRKALKNDPEAMAAMLTSALQLTDGEGTVRVKCGPETARSVRAQLGSMRGNLDVDSIAVEEDPRLEDGDLLLYRGNTTLDARVRTRLDRITTTLYAELGLEPGPSVASDEAEDDSMGSAA